MKQLLLTAAFMAFSFLLLAQEDENEEYELKANEKFGYIITDKDEKIEGIVKMMGTPEAPWVNQKKVKFIAKADIDPTKNRQRLKKMDTDDLKEYVAIEGDKERRFRLVKWHNTREGLLSEGGGLGGTLKQAKNLSITRHMAEVLVDGKVSVFRLYGYPATVAVGQGDIEKMERETQELRDNPTVLVQKGDGKVEAFQAEDIKEMVKDCKLVAEKLEGGQYSSYDPAKQEKKRSGMGKMIKNEVDRAGMGVKLVTMAEEVFGDYNANCK
jgi:hypothetical protein